MDARSEELRLTSIQIHSWKTTVPKCAVDACRRRITSTTQPRTSHSQFNGTPQTAAECGVCHVSLHVQAALEVLNHAQQALLQRHLGLPVKLLAHLCDVGAAAGGVVCCVLLEGDLRLGVDHLLDQLCMRVCVRRGERVGGGERGGRQTTCSRQRAARSSPHEAANNEPWMQPPKAADGVG